MKILLLIVGFFNKRGRNSYFLLDVDVDVDVDVYYADVPMMMTRTTTMTTTTRKILFITISK